MKKSSGNRKEAVLSGVRQEKLYLAVKELHEQEGYPVTSISKVLDLNRSSYYKWLHREKSAHEYENEDLLHKLGYLYAEYNGTYGYRRLTDELNARYETNYNYKRIYRLTQLADIKAAGNVLNTNVPHQKLRLRTF
ncbi:IS3 family transposase [Marinicrinis lubricantis]|uniref:IS3 family transposase n=1 Tax=Marinicrinis lubricantis TaxID=2086470 RepID=UPI0039EE380D